MYSSAGTLPGTLWVVGQTPGGPAPVVTLSWSRMVIHLSWEDIEELVARLVADLPREYDLLLVVTRGGMVPACLISEQTDIRASWRRRSCSTPASAIRCPSGVFAVPRRPAPLRQAHLDRRRRLGTPVERSWRSSSASLLPAATPTSPCCTTSRATPSSRTGPDYYAETTDDWIVYPWDTVRAKPTVGVSAWKRDQVTSEP